MVTEPAFSIVTVPLFKVILSDVLENISGKLELAEAFTANGASPNVLEGIV